jgi:uncharacterized protein
VTAAAATLALGFVIGYLGQRSRLCFAAGYRDAVLTRDVRALGGVGGAFAGALVGYIVFKALGGAISGFPNMVAGPRLDSTTPWLAILISGLGVGIVGVLSGGCPFRMHVLAAEGKKTYWYYLLGFYVGLIFFNLVTIGYLDALGLSHQCG